MYPKIYIYIYVGWIHIYIYIRILYLFFVMYTSCDMVYIYDVSVYIYIYYKQIPNNNGDSPENLDMKSQRPGMNLTFPTLVTANILNEKQLQQDLAAGHDYIDLIRLVLFGKEKEVYMPNQFIDQVDFSIAMITTFSSGDHV